MSSSVNKNLKPWNGQKLMMRKCVWI